MQYESRKERTILNRYFLYLLFIILPFLAACENVDRDMYDTPASKVQEFPRKYNPTGAVPFYGRQANYDQVDGVTLSTSDYFFAADAPERGKKLFTIFCTACHGADGKARTPISDKLDKKPADLTKASVRTLTDGELFVRVLTENTPMPGNRNELTDKEAWEIVSYVREVQEAARK